MTTKESSDGSKAGYYDLPEGAKQLGDLIAYRNLNHADGEMFCAIYRKGRASHSDELRDARKVLYYAQSEVRRLEALEQTRDEKEFPLVVFYSTQASEGYLGRILNDATQQVQVICLSGDGVPQRMTWQDVAKLSAVHPVYIRTGSDGGRWTQFRPTPGQFDGMIIERDGVWLHEVINCDGHKADV